MIAWFHENICRVFALSGRSYDFTHVFLSVRLSLCNLSQKISLILLIFCIKLWVNNRQKLMETNLWGKFSSRHIWAKESKVGPKRQFVIFFDKNCNLIFLLIVSSNINEVIKIVLNLLFFTKRFKHEQNSTKKHQKHKKHKSATKQKHKNANKQTKIKNALKKTSKGKKVTYSLICSFVLAKKKVSTIEMFISLN